MLKLLILLSVSVFCASVSVSAQEKAAKSHMDPLYERIAEDLIAGKPLIISAHYGMWQVRATQPERNLNWGVYYGHATMLKRARKDQHIAKNYIHHDWDLVFEESEEVDPLRTLVFKQTINPNRRWRGLGVKDPFTIYLVMQAHADQEGAALKATREFRQGRGRALYLGDGVTINTGDAQASGYFGHNFFYDYEGFQWDGFEAVKGKPDRQTGVFSVGCKTARVPGFDQWLGQNTIMVLFSKSLMASEGYSTLALADGFARALDSKEFVKLADNSYRYFQQLGKPDRRVGKPFVSERSP